MMLRLILALLLLAGRVWALGTDFDPSQHRAIVCFTMDDYATTATADSFAAHDIPLSVFLAHVMSGGSTKQAAAQYTHNRGHLIGAHSWFHKHMADLWLAGKEDSVRYEFENTQDWVDSLIQAVDPSYECKYWVYPHNEHIAEVDSVGLLYYNMLRGDQYNNKTGIYETYYGGQWPTWRHLYRVVPYWVPNQTGPYYWATPTEVAADDTTNFRTNLTNMLNFLKSIHGVVFVNLHPDPAGNKIDELGANQYSIMFDVLENDSEVWKASMADIYEEFADEFRGNTARAYLNNADCYYSYARTATGYLYGRGTASDPWRFVADSLVHSIAPNAMKQFHRTNIHLGAGYWVFGKSYIWEQQLGFIGAGWQSTTIVIAADVDYYGWRFRDYDWGGGRIWANRDQISGVTIGSNSSLRWTVRTYEMTRLEISACRFVDARAILADTGDSLVVHDCVFDISAAPALNIAATSTVTVLFYGNVFDLNDITQAITLTKPKNTHIYNNIFIPHGSSTHRCIRMYDDSNVDIGTCRIRNNLISHQVASPTYTFRTPSGDVTTAGWASYVATLNAANGVGTMEVSGYADSPYTDISSAPDTVKWGGCQLEPLPARAHGWSSYGLTQAAAPQIPGDFATLQDADSLIITLPWAWSVGDTVSYTIKTAVNATEYGDYRTDSDSLFINLTVGGGANHYGGGWQ